MKRVVAITGASQGMGLAAAKLFAQRGWVVYGGARRVEKIPTEGIHALSLDVTQAKSNQEFVAQILEREGRIDVLINNAGYGEYGPLEETPLEKARKQFETNLFGAAHLANLVLPTMRAQGSGRIINISSIGEDVFTPLGGWYHATKAALRRWSNVLDLEVRPFGVRSLVVQPGGTQTDWGRIALENAETNSKPGSPYADLVQAIRGLFSGDSPVASATSEDLAEVFYRAATDPKPRYAYFHGTGDRLMARLARVHPKLWIRLAGVLLARARRAK
jgi:NAD(P)-dependent dehydrogenase (short-subunit alcohol dehydrogenase family)